MAIIAIDGPSGAGKSTIARAVAKRLGFIYMDTGALYRAIGLHMEEHHIPLDNQQAVVEELENIHLSISHFQDGQHIFLGERDISEEIRTPEISMKASVVSAVPEVRNFLLTCQREMAAGKDIVMDGRDIGTVVFPDADVKLYLSAASEVRAKRRQIELKNKGMDVRYEDVLEDIQKRDYADMHRKVAPLKKAKNAIEIDNSAITLEQAVERITVLIQMYLKGDYIDRQSTRFYDVGQVICNFFFSLYYRIEVRGIENLPPKGTGFVICCNHQSYLDPVMMGLRIKKRYLVFMAKEALFHKPILAPIIKILGAFPVVKGKQSNEAIQTAICKVAEGKMLALFPEGTRSKTGKLLKPKSGAVVIAAKTGADLVPAAIKYYGKRPRSKIVVEFGKPIANAQLGISDHPLPAQIKYATQKMWERVAAIYQGE